MIKFCVLAAGAALSFAVAGEAAAGCCPTCGCAPAVVQVLAPVEPIYVVNQGPVYSGPGHYLNGLGPFVGAIPGPGYPAGRGGYPRGFYGWSAGYPFP